MQSGFEFDNKSAQTVLPSRNSQASPISDDGEMPSFVGVTMYTHVHT
jgi:hypothetical protein